jgi:hypothetical protein
MRVPNGVPSMLKLRLRYPNVWITFTPLSALSPFLSRRILHMALLTIPYCMPPFLSPCTDHMLPFLAKVLADLEVGNGSGLSSFLARFEVHQDCPVDASYINIPDAQTAIICTDGEKVRDTPEEFKYYYENLLKTSRFGQIWANIRLGCSYVFSKITM